MSACPQVSLYLCRDLDSRITAREVAAVADGLVQTRECCPPYGLHVCAMYMAAGKTRTGAGGIAKLGGAPQSLVSQPC